MPKLDSPMQLTPVTVGFVAKDRATGKTVSRTERHVLESNPFETSEDAGVYYVRQMLEEQYPDLEVITFTQMSYLPMTISACPKCCGRGRVGSGKRTHRCSKCDGMGMTHA